MKSPKYLVALLPLQFLTAIAQVPTKNVVWETATRTVTICPVADLPTCEPIWNYPTRSKTTDHDAESTTSASYHSTSTSHSGGSVTSTSGGGSNGTSTGSHGTSTSGGHDGTPTSHSSLSSTTHGGNGTATTTTTSHSISGSPTSSSNSTTSTISSSTSSVCQNATQTATGIPTPNCNSPTTREDWCGPRNVDTDTHTTFTTGHTEYYELEITSDMIDFDGVPKLAYAINGKTPGEPIVANWGDWVEVTVKNSLTDNATTIHWHGVRQIGTNDQDGVPGVTECGIPPGASRTYKWHASTYGTGWYHSHAMAQYGGGIRGPIIIHGPATANYDLDMGTVMVDEIFAQPIFQMAYSIARFRGPLPSGTNYMLNGKNKSPDGLSGENTKWIVKSGKKHLFRIINSAAQSSFAIRFDNHKMTVISADFTPVVPYETEVLWIIPGQRYNVIVNMNQPQGSYQLRAVSQIGCGSSNLNAGNTTTSNGIFQYEGYCGPVTSNNATIATTGICNDEPLAGLIPRVPKTAGSLTAFQETVKLLPGGSSAIQNFPDAPGILRWFLGGQNTSLDANSARLNGSKTINVDYDEPTLKTMAEQPSLDLSSPVYSNSYVLNGSSSTWVYWVIQNNFQISHPMHLHGHDFSILGQGRGVFFANMTGQLNFNNPIRRDTALLFGGGSPAAFVSGWTVIGFQTDNPGAWVMHCHLIWHADGGMGLQFIERPSEITAAKYYSSESFQNECAAYEQYEANGGAVKAEYEAGIKRRHLEDHRLHAHSHGGVVRH